MARVRLGDDSNCLLLLLLLFFGTDLLITKICVMSSKSSTKGFVGGWVLVPEIRMGEPRFVWGSHVSGNGPVTPESGCSTKHHTNEDNHSHLFLFLPSPLV